MKKVILLFSILAELLMISCKRNHIQSAQILNINVLSEDANEINPKILSYIKLETTDSSLIGGIEKIRFYSNYIYVFDKENTKALFVFDSTGKFLAKTKYGKGPGECQIPRDFIIDQNSQSIFLWDQGSRNMLEYDLKLNYLRSYHYKDLFLRNFVRLNSDNILAFIQYPIMDENSGNKTYYNYAIYSSDFGKIEKAILKTNQEQSHLILVSPISPDGKLFIAPYDCNIYELKGDNFRSKYYLNFGKYNVTSEDLKKGIPYLFDLAKKGERIGCLNNIYENRNFLCFYFYFKDGPITCIHDKRKNKDYFSNLLYLNNKLPRFFIYDLLEDNTFISTVSPSDFKRYALKNQLNIGIKETDNPILVKFKI
jgi:hypothetical protein